MLIRADNTRGRVVRFMAYTVEGCMFGQLSAPGHYTTYWWPNSLTHLCVCEFLPRPAPSPIHYSSTQQRNHPSPSFLTLNGTKPSGHHLLWFHGSRWPWSNGTQTFVISSLLWYRHNAYTLHSDGKMWVLLNIRFAPTSFLLLGFVRTRVLMSRSRLNNGATHGGWHFDIHRDFDTRGR